MIKMEDLKLRYFNEDVKVLEMISKKKDYRVFKMWEPDLKVDEIEIGDRMWWFEDYNYENNIVYKIEDNEIYCGIDNREYNGYSKEILKELNKYYYNYKKRN